MEDVLWGLCVWVGKMWSETLSRKRGFRAWWDGWSGEPREHRQGSGCSIVIIHPTSICWVSVADLTLFSVLGNSSDGKRQNSLSSGSYLLRCKVRKRWWTKREIPFVPKLRFVCSPFKSQSFERQVLIERKDALILNLAIWGEGGLRTWARLWRLCSAVIVFFFLNKFHFCFTL